MVHRVVGRRRQPEQLVVGHEARSIHALTQPAEVAKRGDERLTACAAAERTGCTLPRPSELPACLKNSEGGSRLDDQSGFFSSLA
jgi:hypothetical protein